MTERVLNLPAATLKKAEQILADRGTTLEKWVKLQLLRLNRNTRHYDIWDKMNFGQYRDQSLNDIIRNDPEYMVWLLKNIVGFSLTPEALALLESTGVDFTPE